MKSLDDALKASLQELASPDGLVKHSKAVVARKRSSAALTLLIAIVMLGGSVAAAVYGAYDQFGGKRLPGFAPLFLIGGLVCAGGAVVLLGLALFKLFAAKCMEYSSAEDAAVAFYHEVMTEHTFFGPAHALTEHAEAFPSVVLLLYASMQTGWSIVSGVDSVPRKKNAEPISCSKCGHFKPHQKPCTSVEASSIPFKLNDDEVREADKLKETSLFASCNWCKSVVCLACYVASKYLCPWCHLATGGTDGLELRWRELGAGRKKLSQDACVARVEAQRTDHQKVTVSVSGKTFENLAIQGQEGRVVLFSPEPSFSWGWLRGDPKMSTESENTSGGRPL